MFLLNKTYNYLVRRRSYVCIVFVRTMRSKINNATHMIYPFGNCEKQERGRDGRGTSFLTTVLLCACFLVKT